MPREIPDCPNKPNPAPQVTRCYEIQVITPIFGGGVEPRVNDPSFPIRPTAIRGQLQFWWRATVGAQCPTRSDLRKVQSEVWGSTDRASRVRILVENIQAHDRVPCAEYLPGNDRKIRIKWNPYFLKNIQYVLFPFQGQELGKKEQPALYIPKATFQLIVQYPKELGAQVEPAVWAWANFGGVGSRTRRGCGAILCKELAPRDPAHLAEQLKQFAPQQSEIREWPTVGGSVLLGPAEHPGAPNRAWERLIGLFRDFRQGGRNAQSPHQSNTPGRSRFPEPESIRRATGQRWAKHGRQTTIPDDAFPRAELGLPIVFKFKDEKEGEPAQTVLYPSHGSESKKCERMGSPLILKPLALVDGRAIPLILRLKTSPLTGVDLRRGNTSLPLPPTTVVRDARLSRYPNSPLAASPYGSALEAFLAYAQTQGFVEVPR